MNPWALLGVIALWAGTIAGTAAFFYEAGQDSEIADQAEVEKARDDTRAIAAAAVASGIANMEVKHVTIRQQLQTEVRTREVFRDCRSGPDAVRMLNDSPAIAKPAAGAASGGELPTTGAVGR
jgi:hypothetical protein